MRQPPVNTLAPESINAWKLTGAFYESVLWLITIAVAVVSYIFDWPYWIGIALFIISILSTILTIFMLPKLRFRKWRYELFEQEIYIQHGILIMSRTLVPMIRVQHVDTKQGPFLKNISLQV